MEVQTEKFRVFYIENYMYGTLNFHVCSMRMGLGNLADLPPKGSVFTAKIPHG